jgi:A/G-specific adenine glycosylase
VGILEANTTRLYSRLIELDEDPRSSATHRLLWEFADWVVAPRSASSFNQAAMDVGSTICTPDDPSCTQCPVLRRGQKVLMREYSDGERWAGLWDFARFSVSVEEGDQLLSLPRHAKVIQPGLFSADAAPLAVDMAQERTGLQMIDPFLLRKMRHTVTRYRIRLLCVTARQVRGVPDRASGLRWQPIERLNALPLSTTARAIADLVMADT